MIEFVKRAVMLLMDCRIPRKCWLPEVDIEMVSCKSSEGAGKSNLLKNARGRSDAGAPVFVIICFRIDYGQLFLQQLCYTIVTYELSNNLFPCQRSGHLPTDHRQQDCDLRAFPAPAQPFPKVFSLFSHLFSYAFSERQHFRAPVENLTLPK